MGFKVAKIEGSEGKDDTITVWETNESGTKVETVYDDLDSAAEYVKEDAEWLGEQLDNAEYGEQIDLDELHAAEDEVEEESGEGESA